MDPATLTARGTNTCFHTAGAVTIGMAGILMLKSLGSGAIGVGYAPIVAACGGPIPVTVLAVSCLVIGIFLGIAAFNSGGGSEMIRNVQFSPIVITLGALLGIGGFGSAIAVNIACWAGLTALSVTGIGIISTALVLIGCFGFAMLFPVIMTKTMRSTMGIDRPLIASWRDPEISCEINYKN